MAHLFEAVGTIVSFVLEYWWQIAIVLILALIIRGRLLARAKSSARARFKEIFDYEPCDPFGAKFSVLQRVVDEKLERMAGTIALYKEQEDDLLRGWDSYFGESARAYGKMNFLADKKAEAFLTFREAHSLAGRFWFKRLSNWREYDSRRKEREARRWIQEADKPLVGQQLLYK